MANVSEELRALVRRRANERCEYCRIHQDNEPYFRHHIEHIIPKQHGGLDVESNLALACHHCNLHKGPNLSGIDSQTGTIATLFNPRTQDWNDHFIRAGAVITGLSATGRATVRVLAMNAGPRLQLRSLVGDNADEDC
jgi:hypothetical protein